MSQELPVPCYAFQQDALGNWLATEPLSINTPLGLVDIMPGHRDESLQPQLANCVRPPRQQFPCDRLRGR